MCAEIVAPEDLAARAATVDELLSDEFESLPALERDTENAARRLAAWCNSSANGDWELFERRLKRDGYTVTDVRTRFTTARRRPSTPLPKWAQDAEWIQAAVPNSSARTSTIQRPFEHIFSGLVAEAEPRLWASVEASIASRIESSARDDLRSLLIGSLCDLCAPILYDRFRQSATSYDDFVTEMKSGGLIGLFDEKPVLLRLIATLTRQWLTTSTEFLNRLDEDLKQIRHDILHRDTDARVAHIHGGLSDNHYDGRCVLRVEFDDGCVMYKPRDLRLDVAWHSLVERLNQDAPIRLRTAAVIARDGCGWAEFIEHTGCDTLEDCQRFFRRAGAWLAIFHCFVASDMHHENLIAAGDHPVPVDVETLLQPPTTHVARKQPQAQAYETARELIADSVAAVGLLPSYGKSANGVHAAGGVASEWPVGKKLIWDHLNSDQMRPSLIDDVATPSNLPRIGEGHAGLADHIEEFIAGFRAYANFLSAHKPQLFDGFAGLPVRKVIRPTQFYSMLQQRLEDDHAMDDGIVWSVQADFLARLADWDSDTDSRWPLQREERNALLDLNVPLFTTTTDEGLQRARERVAHLDTEQIDWQVDVIRQTSPDLSGLRIEDHAPSRPMSPGDVVELSSSVFLAEANTIAAQITDYAVREGSSAAWLGLGWFPDSNVTQLTVLGHDFYNGACGIATFLAAHARVAQSQDSADLALAAITHVRAELRSRRAPRMGRVMGIGGATGLGSIIYGLTCISRLLDDVTITAETVDAARLFNDELIATDTQLDVIGGSAGAILSLLSLYHHTQSDEVLNRAVACGNHLLAQPRVGTQGHRSWPCRSSNNQVLNGMSHGAAGFAYALTALATATGTGEFCEAAMECLEFERSNFDAQRSDWCDLRVSEPHWRSQWCHGAVGIGLARLGMSNIGLDTAMVRTDIDHALTGAARGWPGHADTLCCGALGSVELAHEAGKILGHPELQRLATKRLSAILHAKQESYRWSVPVSSRFNVGLFRGLAGVGYTYLREVDVSLPNLLVWG